MATNLLALLTKLSTGKLVILFLFLVITFNILYSPGIETLDMQSSYSVDKAYELIGSYGEAGRQYYAVIELTVDVIYPILAALFFSTFTIYFFRRIFPLNSFWQKLPLLGPIVMVVDYLENTGIVVMLLNYPHRLELVAQATNIFTITKFVLSGLELILILIGLIGWLGKAVYVSVKKHAGLVDSKK